MSNTDNILVYIDAGHGSTTAGKRTPDGYREHWINVKSALACEQYLQANGIKTGRVGWDDADATDDVDISLTQRQKQVKSAGADYVISFHANAFGDGKTYNSAKGVSTHIHSNSAYLKDSVRFGQCIQKRLVEGTKQQDRGVIRQSLAMCNCKTMGVKAAALVEIAFMTNKEEAKLLMTDAFCKEQGEDVARGILDYLGVPLSNPVVTPTPVPEHNLVISPMNVTMGNPEQFIQIIMNIKTALNADYGLQFVINGSIDNILLDNLANVELSNVLYMKNITYALSQLLIWWGYSLPQSSVYSTTVKQTIMIFQKQLGLKQTGTTTKDVWYKLLGK